MTKKTDTFKLATIVLACVVVVLLVIMIWPSSEDVGFSELDSGCRVYDMDFIVEKDSLPEFENTSAFTQADVSNCVRVGSLDDLSTWAGEYDEEYAESTPILVATEDFSIVPLYGADSVIWVCPKETQCRWSTETLGHSSLYYFDIEGTPRAVTF